MFSPFVRVGPPQDPFLFWSANKKSTPRAIAASNSWEDSGATGLGLGPVVAKGDDSAPQTLPAARLEAAQKSAPAQR
jgi:hypothetical protein